MLRLLEYIICILTSMYKFLLFVLICYLWFTALRDNTWIIFAIFGLFLTYFACRSYYKWLVKKPEIKPPTPEKKWYEYHREKLKELEKEGKL